MTDNTEIKLTDNPNLTAFSSQEGFVAAQRMAQALVSSSMVPKIYQGNQNLGNAIIALEMSQRLGANPLMIMQNLYIVHGNPSWSAKFLIATFNQCGRFSAIRYRWTTDLPPTDPNYGCQAYATELSTGEEVTGPWITWQLVKSEGWDSKNGSKWKTMPQKMFMYRAAGWMVDTIAPEISMGLPTAEDMHDVYDVDKVTGEVKDANTGETVQEPASRSEALRQKMDQKAETINTATGEVEEAVYEDA